MGEDRILTIGEKISFYRKRAGMSQLELEVRIGAGQGSISRLENGQINPTKETLHKIIDELGIPSRDAAILLGIDLYKDIADLIDLTTELNSFSINEIMKATAVFLVKKLGLMDLALFIVKEDNLWAHSMAQTPQVRLIEKVLPKAFNQIKIPIYSEASQNNIMIRAILDKSEKLTYDLYDLAQPVLPKKTTEAIIKLSGFKSCLVIPLINDDKVLGVLVFTKNYVDSFKHDKEVLMAFARSMKNAVSNVRTRLN